MKISLIHKQKPIPMNILNSVKTAGVLVLCTILSLKSLALRPTANFSATPISGCAPLLVNFSDLSTGNPTSWTWNLGNGTISNIQNPSAVFLNPGQYTVKLVVQNASGSDSVTRTQFITVYAKPAINFSASNTSGCAPLTTTFTDLSSSSNTNIVSRQWDFGNGNFSNLSNPTHTYNTPGNYNVSLMLTNSNGCSASSTQTNFINISDRPIVNFTNSNPINCGAPYSVSFINGSTGVGGLSFIWRFGDGTSSTQINPTHIYNTSGNYTVKLIVTNALGCKDSLIKSNLVQIGNAYTMFTSPTTVCANQQVQITNTSNPIPSITSWNFGDGTTSSDVNPIKTYTNPGTYYIKLINDFGTCKDSLVRTIIVKASAIADFNATPTNACQTPLVVNFNNQSSNASSYVWYFGNGDSSTSSNPVYTYINQGSFDVTLVATSIQGCSDTSKKVQYIKVQAPQASILNLPQRGCAPYEITFESSVIAVDPIVSYLWNFGDGTTSTLTQPTHTYTSRGNYTVSLIVFTESGCTDTVIVANGVKIGLEPHPQFQANTLSACAETPILFSNLTPSTDSVDSWLWNFGDGSISTMQNPTHAYSDTGFMTVSLVANNNGCKDTLEIKDYIFINAPIAKFKSVLDCKNKLTRTFTDLSIDADTWNWDFGDGNTSTDQNPIHIFDGNGNYDITLLTNNSITGCSSTITKTIRIINEMADFFADQTTICKENSVRFSSTNKTYFNSFKWEFGDGTTATDTAITKTYFLSGIYNISLYTKDLNGCKDTITKNNYITVNGPTADFSSTNTGICANTSAIFTDLSTSDGRNSIVSWIWNYGDNNVDTLASGNTSHLYHSNGNYTITLIAIDNTGCKNKIEKTNYINVASPIVNFNTIDTVSCPNGTITFNNLSTGSYLTYSWDFGDGSIASSIVNPTHQYVSNGLYTVKLLATNPNGCKDSMIRNNYLNILSPIASFEVSDSVGNCPPLIVNFTNNSENGISYEWNFGDGTNSTLENPSHFYSIAGTYFAKLTVTSIGGCTSVFQKKIVVHGPSGTFTYNTLVGCAPKSTNFVATVLNTISFVWDYNDGNTIVSSNSTQTHSYINSGHYLPKLLLKDASGCVVPLIGSDSIIVHETSAEFNFNSSILCDKGNIQFINSSNSTDIISGYNWNFGDGTTSTVANPAHTYTTSGFYYPNVTLTTINGCVGNFTSPYPVKIIASPQGTITQTANGCAGVVVAFNGGYVIPDTSNVNWAWDFGNGSHSSLINPTSQTYPNAGNYNVTAILTNNSGCKDTVHSSVEAYAFPLTEAGIDTFVCKGRGTSLNASGAATYSWSPSIGLSCVDCVNPIANPTTNKKYYVVGTSIHGCSSKDSLFVTVKYPFNMNASSKQKICRGFGKQLFANGAENYVWSPSTGLDNPTSNIPVANPSINTVYTVIGSDNKHCFYDTAKVTVEVYNNPTVELGEDKTMNVGQTIDLVAKLSSDVIETRWSPSGPATRTDLSVFTIKPRETTTYTIDAFTSIGCKASDQITVNVLCNGTNLFIPNTFTPNNDGINDLFYPRGSGILKIKKVQIFSRWGQVVYEKNNIYANDVTSAWDGTFNGRPLNQEVYVYIVEAMCENNTTLSFKGNIALIR